MLPYQKPSIAMATTFGHPNSVHVTSSFPLSLLRSQSLRPTPLTLLLSLPLSLTHTASQPCKHRSRPLVNVSLHNPTSGTPYHRVYPSFNLEQPPWPPQPSFSRITHHRPSTGFADRRRHSGSDCDGDLTPRKKPPHRLFDHFTASVGDHLSRIQSLPKH